MFRSLSLITLGLCLVLGTSSRNISAAELFGLAPGALEFKSVGPMAFGPSGVLFVGDPKAAKVYAINTNDKKTSTDARYEIEDFAEACAKAIGAAEVTIADLIVNPETGNAFASLSTGDGFAIVKVTPDGSLIPLELEKIGHSSVTLPEPPEDKLVQLRRRSVNARDSSITDLAYMSGRVLVSGLAAGDSPSSVREFDFPFNEKAKGFRVEIFHGAHGKNEDHAPIQTFVPFNIDGEPSLLAGYQCTPLVKIPVAGMEVGGKVKGTTVAELGNRNRPLDMIVYQQNDADYLLLANSDRGVMKITTENIAENQGLTERVSRGETAGQTYETIDDLQGVVQLDKLDDDHALVLMGQTGGPLALRSVKLP